MATVSTDKPRPERLVKARMLQGLTQQEQANALGVSVFYIGKLERGERSPSGALLRRWSQQIEKPIEWFYGDGHENGASPAGKARA